MARAPFEVLVYLFRYASGSVEYALLRRSDEGWWQAIAGGGEEGESPLQAARREASEEAGCPLNSVMVSLQTVFSVPVTAFRDSASWGDDLYVIPCYCFGIEAISPTLTLSHEHMEYRWLTYDEAQAVLHYDGDRNALWELNQRLLRRGPRE